MSPSPLFPFIRIVLKTFFFSNKMSKTGEMKNFKHFIYFSNKISMQKDICACEAERDGLLKFLLNKTGKENLLSKLFWVSHTDLGSRNKQCNTNTTSLCLQFLSSKRLNISVPRSLTLSSVSSITLPKYEDGLFEAKVSFEPQKPLPQVPPHNLLHRPRFSHPLLPLPLPSDFPCFGISISWESSITTTSKPASLFNCFATCSWIATRARTCSRTSTCSGICSWNWGSTFLHSWLRWVLCWVLSF